MDLSLTDTEQRSHATCAPGSGRSRDPSRYRGPGGVGGVGQRLAGRAGPGRMGGINWPEDYGGRGASPVEVAIFNAEYARSGAPQLVNRVGINLAGPTLLAHGTPEQCRRWLPAIVSAEEIWCQLFSEPGAGSDLSGLVTRADPDPDSGGWRVSGQRCGRRTPNSPVTGCAWRGPSPGTSGPRGLSLLVVEWSPRASTSDPWCRSPGRPN